MHSRVQKESCDITSKFFSDAALMILYLTILLSKAAESDRCRGGQSANRTFDREDHLHSRVQKESSDITAKAISDAALMTFI